MNNTQRADLLDEVTSAFSAWVGKMIAVTESISRSPGLESHDRHFATRTTFSFVLSQATWAISGGRLIVLGEQTGFIYEVAFDVVSSGEVSSTELRLVETFGSAAERISIFKRLST